MSAGRFLGNLRRRQLDDMLGSIKREFPELAPFDISLQEFKTIHQAFENTENSMLDMRNAVIDRLKQEQWSLEKSHFLTDKKILEKNLSLIIKLLVFKKHYQAFDEFNRFYEIQNSASLAIVDKMFHSYLFLKDNAALHEVIQHKNINNLIPDLENQQDAFRQITDFLTTIKIEKTAGRTYNTVGRQLENLLPMQEIQLGSKIREMLKKNDSFVTIIETLTKEILTTLVGYLKQTFKHGMPLTCGELLSAAIQSFVFKTEGAGHIQQVLELEISKQILIFVGSVEQKEREPSNALDTFESIMQYINENLKLDEKTAEERIKVELSEKCVSEVRHYISFLNYFPVEIGLVKTIINSLNPEDHEHFLEDLLNHPGDIAEKLDITSRERTASPVSIAGRSSPALFSFKSQDTSSRSSSPTPFSEK